MTLVLFFLLLLVVGVADFGRAFYSYIVITNASREGARRGSHFSHDAPSIRAAAKAESGAGGVVLEDANIDIDPNPVEDDDGDPDDGDGTAAQPGQPIAVTVTYDVDTIIGHIAGFDTVPLQARTEMVVFWTAGAEEED
jgi:hypothetical protein